MKKSLGILLISLLLLQPASYGSAEIKQTYGQKDRSESILDYLNIASGYGNSPLAEEKLTRAELAESCVRLLNLDIDVQLAKSFFDDVPKEHPASAAVNQLYQLSYLNGVGNRLFDPDGFVTLSQAVKVLDDLLGYTPLAGAKGGYPAGYLMVANEIGLLKGVSDTGFQSDITKGLFYSILNNALQAEMYFASGVSGESVVYKMGGTLLEKYHQITEYKGLVTETEITSFNSAGTLPPGKIKMKTEQHQDITLDISEVPGDYLAKFIRAYVKTIALDDHQVIYLSEDSKKTNQLMINGEDIQQVIAERIIYLKNDRESSARLLRGFDSLYNGVAEPLTAEELKISSGYLQLVDTDLDQVYDVAMVWQPKTIIAQGYHQQYGVLADRFHFTNSMTIDENDLSTLVEVTKYGEKMTLSSIREWDVLSVYEARAAQGRRVIRIEISTDTVMGNIQSVSAEEIVIDGVAYPVSPGYAGEIDPKAEGVFLLDSLGKICGIKSGTVLSRQFAFLTAIAIGSDTEPGKAKLYQSTGTFATYELTDHPILNGERISNQSRIIQELRTAKFGSDQNQQELSQLIQIRLNQENKIQEINTAGPKTKGEEPAFTWDIKNETNRYRSDVFSFGSKCLLNSQTLIFKVPDQLGEENQFRMLLNSELSQGIDYRFSAYNLSEAGVAEAVVISGDIITPHTNDTKWNILTKKTIAVTSDGVLREKLYFLDSNGSAFNTYATETSIIREYENGTKIDATDLEAGDILRVSLNSASEIQNADRLFDMSRLKNLTTGEYNAAGKSDGNDNALMRVVIGRPEQIDAEGRVRIDIFKPALGGKKTGYYNMGKSKFILAEETGAGFSIRQGTLSDVLTTTQVGAENASYLVFKARYTNPQEVYIYRFKEDPCL